MSETDDAGDVDAIEAYERIALVRGRPGGTCGCQACDCDLPTYSGEIGCVWCSNGQHAEDDDGEPFHPVTHPATFLLTTAGIFGALAAVVLVEQPPNWVPVSLLSTILAFGIAGVAALLKARGSK